MMSSHNDSFVSSGSSPTESSGPDFIVENQNSEYKGAARDACALTQGPKRRGRPRKYENDAAKQADYRRREELKQELKKTDEQINSQGRLHGETLYGPEKVEQIAAAIAQEKFIGGSKVGPPQANNPKQSIGDWRESARKTGRIT